MHFHTTLIVRALTGTLILLSAAFVRAQGFTNLYSFTLNDGAQPAAGLLLTGGALYGTTANYGGGTGGGFGTVFKLATDGSVFTNLHTFSGTDGGGLSGSLVLAGDTLYGTATYGGASNHGCIFAINSDGTDLTNLYSFSPLSAFFPYTNGDGAFPQSGLVLSGNTLYGTASEGGAFGWGMILAVNTDGSGFTNLHNFASTDGQFPGPLILSANVLYGTAIGGGSFGYGTIFKMNTDGSAFTNLYSFSVPDIATQTNYDGAFPLGALLLSGTTLYGVTSDGGSGGNGTVFKLNTDGTGFVVLHAFSATNALVGINSDGARPQSGLTLWSNVLYGTAEYGGTFGNGTVFSVTTDGTAFATLYNFTSTNDITGTNADGAYPLGCLAISGDTLYGTASAGGADGYGTVFSILLPPPLNMTVLQTNIVLTWPTNFMGFNLQFSTDFVASSWINLAGQYAVTNPMSFRQRFYRLVHP